MLPIRSPSTLLLVILVLALLPVLYGRPERVDASVPPTPPSPAVGTTADSPVLGVASSSAVPTPPSPAVGTTADSPAALGVASSAEEDDSDLYYYVAGIVGGLGCVVVIVSVCIAILLAGVFGVCRTCADEQTSESRGGRPHTRQVDEDDEAQDRLGRLIRRVWKKEHRELTPEEREEVLHPGSKKEARKVVRQKGADEGSVRIVVEEKRGKKPVAAVSVKKKTVTPVRNARGGRKGGGKGGRKGGGKGKKKPIVKVALAPKCDEPSKKDIRPVAAAGKTHKKEKKKKKPEVVLVTKPKKDIHPVRKRKTKKEPSIVRVRKPKKTKESSPAPPPAPREMLDFRTPWPGKGDHEEEEEFEEEEEGEFDFSRYEPYDPKETPIVAPPPPAAAAAPVAAAGKKLRKEKRKKMTVVFDLDASAAGEAEGDMSSSAAEETEGETIDEPKGCPNMLSCRRFLREAVGLERGRFYDDQLVCYCRECVAARGEAGVLTVDCAGRPSTYPRGWVKFGIHPSDSPRFRVDKIHETWCRAYHGTSVKSAKKVIVGGVLLRPGLRSAEGQRVSLPSGHIDYRKVDKKKNPRLHRIMKRFCKSRFVSPSLKYAAEPVYSEGTYYKDATFQVVLEARIKPGSFRDKLPVPPFKPGQVHTLARDFKDPLFPATTCLEWFSDREGAMIMTGLLVLETKE